MTRRAAKAKSQSTPRRLGRRLLDNMISDLAGRLGALAGEAEAFATIIKPNEQHSDTEYHTRTACGVLLASLQRRIRDVEGLARLLVR